MSKTPEAPGLGWLFEQPQSVSPSIEETLIPPLFCRRLRRVSPNKNRTEGRCDGTVPTGNARLVENKFRIGLRVKVDGDRKRQTPLRKAHSGPVTGVMPVEPVLSQVHTVRGGSSVLRDQLSVGGNDHLPTGAYGVVALKRPAFKESPEDAAGS